VEADQARKSSSVAADRIIFLGDPLFDSTVTGFALNPASVNEVGQLGSGSASRMLGSLLSGPIQLDKDLKHGKVSSPGERIGGLTEDSG
jgi:hypothetical protein